MGHLHSVAGARFRSNGQKFCQKSRQPSLQLLPVTCQFVLPAAILLAFNDAFTGDGQTHVPVMCLCCKADFPKEHTILYIHLNCAHQMELLPGCPLTTCNYFSSR